MENRKILAIVLLSVCPSVLLAENASTPAGWANNLILNVDQVDTTGHSNINIQQHGFNNSISAKNIGRLRNMDVIQKNGMNNLVIYSPGQSLKNNIDNLVIRQTSEGNLVADNQIKLRLSETGPATAGSAQTSSTSTFVQRGTGNKIDIKADKSAGLFAEQNGKRNELVVDGSSASITGTVYQHGDDNTLIVKPLDTGSSVVSSLRGVIHEPDGQIKYLRMWQGDVNTSDENYNRKITQNNSGTSPSQIVLDVAMNKDNPGAGSQNTIEARYANIVNPQNSTLSVKGHITGNQNTSRMTSSGDGFHKHNVVFVGDYNRLLSELNSVSYGENSVDVTGSENLISMRIEGDGSSHQVKNSVFSTGDNNIVNTNIKVAGAANLTTNLRAREGSAGNNLINVNLTGNGDYRNKTINVQGSNIAANVNLSSNNEGGTIHITKTTDFDITRFGNYTSSKFMTVNQIGN